MLEVFFWGGNDLLLDLTVEIRGGRGSQPAQVNATLHGYTKPVYQLVLQSQLLL